MFNETANLYISEGDFKICYEKYGKNESSLNMKRSAKRGDRFPLWTGVSGRCFPVFMSPEDVDRILSQPDPLTPNTIFKKVPGKAKTTELRRLGYSMSVSEREQEVSSAAAPIFAASMQAAACMTLSGPTSRFPEEMVRPLIPMLKKTCLDISLTLGAERSALSLLQNSE